MGPGVVRPEGNGVMLSGRRLVPAFSEEPRGLRGCKADPCPPRTRQPACKVLTVTSGQGEASYNVGHLLLPADPELQDAPGDPGVGTQAAPSICSQGPQARHPAGVPAPDSSPGSEAVHQGKEGRGQDSRALMCVGPCPLATCSPCPWGPRGSQSSLGTLLSFPNIPGHRTRKEGAAFWAGASVEGLGRPLLSIRGSPGTPVNTPSAQKIGRGSGVPSGAAQLVLASPRARPAPLQPLAPRHGTGQKYLVREAAPSAQHPGGPGRVW